MFPALAPGGGTADTSAVDAGGFLRGRWGPYPFAMSNPIFVDMDGDGRWRGQPL